MTYSPDVFHLRPSGQSRQTTREDGQHPINHRKVQREGVGNNWMEDDDFQVFQALSQLVRTSSSFDYYGTPSGPYYISIAILVKTENNFKKIFIE